MIRSFSFTKIWNQVHSAGIQSVFFSLSKMMKRIDFAIKKPSIVKGIGACTQYPHADVLKNSRVIHTVETISYAPEDVQSVFNIQDREIIHLYGTMAYKNVQEACKILHYIEENGPSEGVRFIQVDFAGVTLLRVNKMGNEAKETAAILEMTTYNACVKEDLQIATVYGFFIGGFFGCVVSLVM